MQERRYPFIKTIYWITKRVELIDRIRKRFNIIVGMTVNGENKVTITSEKDFSDLLACQERGLLQIRNKE